MSIVQGKNRQTITEPFWIINQIIILFKLTKLNLLVSLRNVIDNEVILRYEAGVANNSKF